MSPSLLKTIALELVVPWSKAKINLDMQAVFYDRLVRTVERLNIKQNHDLIVVSVKSGWNALSC
jgi:hypothetical protein